MAPVVITITVPDFPTLTNICSSSAPGQAATPVVMKAAILTWLVASVVASQQAIAATAALAAVAPPIPPTLA